MSYTHAQKLASPYNAYRLTGLVRGQNQTAITDHNAGSDFAVLDGSIYVIPLTKNYLGRTLYIKLPSFNQFKGNNQELSATYEDGPHKGELIVKYYNYMVKLYDLPNVSELIAVASGFSITESVNAYQINVKWKPPGRTEIVGNNPQFKAWEDYQNAMVWYKNNNQQNWIYADSGYDSAIITQAIPGDTYTIAVCVKDKFGNYELPDESTKTTCTVAVSAETPNTPTGFSIKFTDVITVSWNVVTNSIIRAYEVRSSANRDTSNNILYSGTGNIATIQLASRSGKLYLYAISCYGVCSAAAVLDYNKNKPTAPVLNCKAGIKQIQIRSNDIPNDCYAIRYTIDGANHDYQFSNNQTLNTIQAESDIYDITACFIDVFGMGEESTSKRVVVDEYIPQDLIEAESISIGKLSSDVQKAIEEGGIDTVNIAVKGLLGAGAALVMQPDGKLALVTSNGEVLTGLFIDKDGVLRLQGKYTHITGDTLIDGNVITESMIQAGAVTAEKLDVKSLSAICATIGELKTANSGARVVIKDNLIQVFDSNNVLRVRMGVW